ncbi:hypothetical protein PR202_ga29335 [Eleusine coracana subsp. coracana]|uniref:Uncharacterized protein n=1 Tax=Eleusine coracana subsp. coracana TaxID=191504 RepID=A0AAV5DKX4_ELECO|nr:hypothetical protein QOZ80_7AG0575140 [Eleusine coracana subsp. coracana]GJN11162.1 hypothetical protein PR202_ga29335 [Eleusine coracana subsp. coracana]
MAAGTGTEPRAADSSASDVADEDNDDFEFCVVSSAALAQAGRGAKPDMCVADELFSNGKLLPLRPSSDGGPTYVLLPRSESAASTAGFGSRSDSRSASSSGSSSGCVSRSQSSSSAASAADHGARRSMSSSVFYAHPSPSPQLRWARPRRSTGSAPPPPAAWGILRLGVAGAPDVYPPRAAGEAKIAVVARGGSRSARFEQAAAAVDGKTKFNLGMFGESFGCRCSPDAVEPVRVPKPAKKQSGKKDGAKRSRILQWLEELSITKEKK